MQGHQEVERIRGSVVEVRNLSMQDNQTQVSGGQAGRARLQRDTVMFCGKARVGQARGTGKGYRVWPQERCPGSNGKSDRLERTI